MKKLQFPILLICIGLFVSLLFAFQKPTTNMKDLPPGDYEKAWKTIDSLEHRGLPKSALTEVEKILSKARRENNTPNTIRAIIYRGKYESQLEEDGFVNAVNKIESELKSAKTPAKEVLHSMLGEMYSSYAEQNAYQFSNRTETLDFKNDDLRTWTLPLILEKAEEHYLKSVTESTRNYSVEDIDEITNSDIANDEKIRPTIYDFLTHRAIRFFVNERNYLDESASKFVIRDESYFTNANTFSKLNLQKHDSRKSKALRFLQDLLRFHLQSGNKAALVDADRARLEFVYNNAIVDGKGKLYEKSLRGLWKNYELEPISTEVAHQLAQYFNNEEQNYQPIPHWQENNDKVKELNGKWNIQKAYEICNEAISMHPKAIGSSQCQVLQFQITRPSVDVKVEKVYLPNQSMLAHLQFKNMKTAHFKIVKITEKQLREFDEWQWESKMNYLNNLPIVQNRKIELPDDGDYRSHAVEFEMTGLPNGMYIALVSDNGEFSNKTGMVTTNRFQVSNLAYVQGTGDELGKIQFFAIHRKTGQPLEGVKAEIFTNDYNRLKRQQQLKKIGTFSSNKNGEIIPKLDKRGSFTVRFSKDKDVLLSDGWFGNYPRNNQTNNRQRAHFFLDRGIYRPGQTVYFKVLAVEYDKNQMPSVLKNHPVDVTFKDANYQDIKTLKLTTNEYGTVNGSFIAPTAGLLGRMSLTSFGNSTHSIRVEEYKRPKFEVKIDTIKDAYKLGEQVTINGNAKAYAGNNIDGAKVTYRVVRETSFPYWPWWRCGWYNPWHNRSMEITNGTTKTDENGNFRLDFLAKADSDIPEDRNPQFNFTIYADVTDITGETQSTKSYARAGYISLDFNIQSKEIINLSEQNELTISAKNLNGADQKVEAEVQVFKLDVPNKIFKKRYWDKPDKQLMSRTEFEKSFPHFAYGNEDENNSWKPGPPVLSQKVTVNGETKINLGGKKLSPGAYRVVAITKDKFGESVEKISFFTAYKENDKRPPVPSVLFSAKNKQKVEPGDKASLLLFTSEDELCVYGKLSNRTTSLRNGWINVKTNRKIDHDIVEADRGGMGMKAFAIRENRYYDLNEIFQVPWNNKDLNIEYATFRDKLKPGQEEEWTLKISGNKKEKVAAEMVAAMYDASLDAFVSNNWNFSPFPNFRHRFYWNADNFQMANSQFWMDNRNRQPLMQSRNYRSLNWFNWYFGRPRYQVMSTMASGGAVRRRSSAPEMAEAAVMDSSAPMMKQDETTAGQTLTSEQLKNLPTKDVYEVNSISAGLSSENLSQIPVRTNLNETVFFFPNLMTDPEGNVLLKFMMNEALTKWKFLSFAHTPDLQTAISEKMVQTQKELMVVPNAPRFFREGDKIEFTAKVSNLTEKEMAGTAQLLLFDALTDEPIDIALGNNNSTQKFLTKPGQSDRLAWTIEIPFGGAQAIKHRVVAKSGNFSDGEESVVPVLTNRMLVTETLPLPVRGGEIKTFIFDELKNANSSTLANQGLTLEYTSNPAWYAVQSLPYLMEYPHQCTEQVFSRFYANSLATHVANDNPKVKNIFDRWKNYEPEALKSNLSKNQELKTALLEETPWVLDAQNEEQQKQNIGLLFDLNRMSYELDNALATLAERQEGNGGWAWFPGGRPNWYITQYVVEGLGHLQRLGVRPLDKNPKYRGMMEKAIRYCDSEIEREYRELGQHVKAGRTNWEDDHLGHIIIHYLYARSFFLPPAMSQINKENVNWRDQIGISMSRDATKAFEYYHGQAEKYWVDKGMYQQGLLALTLDRVNKSEQQGDIVKSLKERSLNNEELGMYWKYNRGWNWYQAPIETHSLMIEVFQEVAKDQQSVDDLKVWLLKNKQTNNWKTTKATASAVYALLMSGNDWLTDSKPVKVTFPSASNSSFEKAVDKVQTGAEAGTGYFKLNWDKNEMNKSLATVKVQNPNNVISWGSLYWQYFEDLDKIKTFEKTPLQLKKQLFKVELSDTGEKIRQVSKSDIKVGDKLKVRIELRVDRDMEYVHMKDTRASGFEPMNVLSSYKWQDGLGYYESTRDASTNFFFDYLPKGTYVFEYPLRVVHNGDFSNGVTTIQCMYAPEFTSHSEGERFEINE